MFTSTRDAFAEHGIASFLPTQTISEAQNLWYRYQEGKSFRFYLRDRQWLIVPAVLLILLIALTLGASFVVVAIGTSGWLALPAIILMPVVLIGSLFVQAYVLFSWLENRAMARILRQRTKRSKVSARASKKFSLDMGPAPSIPWVFVGLFFVAPLALLGTFVPEAAWVVLGAVIILPVVYAKLDR